MQHLTQHPRRLLVVALVLAPAIVILVLALSAGGGGGGGGGSSASPSARPHGVGAAEAVPCVAPSQQKVTAYALSRARKPFIWIAGKCAQYTVPSAAMM